MPYKMLRVPLFMCDSVGSEENVSLTSGDFSMVHYGGFARIIVCIDFLLFY